MHYLKEIFTKIISKTLVNNAKHHYLIDSTGKRFITGESIHTCIISTFFYIYLLYTCWDGIMEILENKILTQFFSNKIQ